MAPLVLGNFCGQQKVNKNICLSIEWKLYTCQNYTHVRHINPSENSPHRVKCHKIVMIYPEIKKIATSK